MTTYHETVRPAEQDVGNVATCQQRTKRSPTHAGIKLCSESTGSEPGGQIGSRNILER